jgi:predicted PurR-regulated permease PerM
MSAESRGWFLLALLVLAGWLIWRLAPVITPFAISAGLAYLGDPMVDRLERLRFFRWPISRTVSVVLVFALMTALLVLVLLILIPLLSDQVRELVRRAPQIFEWLVGTALPWLQARLGLDVSQLDPDQLIQTASAYWKEAGTALIGVLGSVSRGGQAALTWLMNLVLIPVVTFYLLRDWDRLVEGVRNLLPRSVEPAAARVGHEIDVVLGAFIRGQLMVMLALGLIYAIGLWLVGLDLAFIIGIGAGLLSIVPYLGTFVGVVAAVIAALFQFQDVLHVVFVLAVFGVGQTLEGMVLTPKLVGDQIGLHPVAVIFAVLAGGQLFGFLGVLLALPVAAALNVLVRHLDRRYRGSAMYRRAAGPAESAADGDGGD